MKKAAIICLLSLFFAPIKAWEKRDLLQKEATIEFLKATLLNKEDWISYPRYSDRKGWDKLTLGYKQDIILKGEASLQYEWKVIKASDYLEFERSGSRKIMETPFNANVTALADMVLAELAEGKGRFMEQIVNGVWASCEMTSWALSAHISREQKEKTSLPSFKEHIIDLTSGDMGAFLAWTFYFMKDEMNKIQPLVSERLLTNLRQRILDPYLNRSTFWWQAFDASPQTMVNNWNPWCNFDVLTCFLLLEDDKQKLAEGVYRTMISADKFINYYHSDGACEEGPSYWGHAPGKLYDYLQILYSATGGKVSVFDNPLIKNMGEYIVRSYAGNGWVVNFADASAKGGGEPGMIFRYGKAVNSIDMQQFAAYLIRQNSEPNQYNAGRDIFRTLENLQYRSELDNTEPALSQPTTTWYPQTEFCYIRNHSGYLFTAIGGHNAESHNHNDVGSFMLYMDQTPVIIDAGVGTYTRQTFSDERYTIWTMQSNYHNIPMINGVPQNPGKEFRSRKVSFDPVNSTFSLDLSGAYPEEASVKKWQRIYKLNDESLLIEDNFNLLKAKEPNRINFLTWVKPEVEKPGEIKFSKESKQIIIRYKASQFDPIIEVIELKDIRLSNIWGPNIYRLTFKAKILQETGSYKFEIRKL